MPKLSLSIIYYSAFPLVMFKKILNQFGLQDLIILLAVIPMLHLQLTDFAQDPGVGWHLSTGELIADSGSIPTIDPFLYSLNPRSWICDQWLSDLIIYKLFELGSWQILYLFFSIVYLVSYFALLYPCVAIVTGSRIASAFICYLAMRAGLIHFILRPVVFGQFIFCALFVVISYFRVSKISKRSLFLICPTLFLLWANMHPSFFLGFLLCFCLVAEGLYKKVWLEEYDRQLTITVLQSCLLLLVCFAASLLNPYGIKLHASILELARSDFFLNYHSEWQSLNFKQLEGRVTQIFIFIFALSFLIRRACKDLKSEERNPDSFAIVSLLIFGHLGFEMIRALPNLLVVATVPVTQSLLSLSAGISARRERIAVWFSKLLFEFERRERKTLNGFPALIIVFICLVGNLIFNNRILLYQGSFGPSPDSRAVSIIQRLELQARESQRTFVLLASPDFGGAITFYGKGRVKAVIDDRNTLLGENLYREFTENFGVSVGGQKLSAYISLVGANFVLLSQEDALAIQLAESNFQKVLEDSKFVVFQM